MYIGVPRRLCAWQVVCGLCVYIARGACDRAGDEFRPQCRSWRKVQPETGAEARVRIAHRMGSARENCEDSFARLHADVGCDSSGWARVTYQWLPSNEITLSAVENYSFLFFPSVVVVVIVRRTSYNDAVVLRFWTTRVYMQAVDPLQETIPKFQT